MNKKIITIAEIVFALVFVVLLAVFMATINSKGNTANNQLVDVLESVNGASLDKYAQGQSIKGTDVANVVENYSTLSGDTKITILVATNEHDKSEAYPKYGYVEGKSETYPIYNCKSTDKDYINPTGDFTPELVYNANDVLIGLIFRQNKVTRTDAPISLIDKAVKGSLDNQN